MIRITGLTVAAFVGLLLGTAPASAQVVVRAPFVEVQTGPGVYVRAPFFRMWIPGGPPAYVVRPGVQVVVPPPAVIQTPPPPTVVPQQPALPAPQVVPGANTPPPLPQPLPTAYPTLAEFARNFQAKGGQYNVTVLHPLTGQDVQVNFALPEGTPRRVIVEQDEIEFRYSLRQWVRIEFTRNGVVVTSR